MSVLDTIKNPEDVKRLDKDKLCDLCSDLRGKIISTTEKNGGHLSSNLGIVETTVALYKYFDFKKDRLVFDVGHQCYAHKLLSGRKDVFSSIRKSGGISGFPNVNESEYDAFTAGHAGTSVSAGLGYCVARDALKEDYSVVVIVGDGSLVNGLNLEAITSSVEKPKNFLVVLNDNGMSISKNGNALYRQISKGAANVGYYKGKSAVKKVFKDSFVTKILHGIKNAVKRIMVGNNFFEQYGFKYVGVVDGNDLKKTVKIVGRAKKLMKYKAVLLHVKTTKGKGLKQAEERSDAYHGVGKNFDISGGGYAETLGETLNGIMDGNEKVVAITAAMKDGTGLKSVEEKHPDRFFDAGIAEEYAVTFAAGMAAGGLKPVVAIYSTFLQRAYDQILHDVCLMNLPVVFCLDRAGLVGADGATHQGIFDLSYLSSIPNMTVLAPTNRKEFKEAINYAFSLGSPVAIRYPKDDEFDCEVSEFGQGWQKVYETPQAENVFLAVGPRTLKNAVAVAEKIGASVYNARVVKPLDEKILEEVSSKTVITLEENVLTGGFGSAVSEYYAKKGYKTTVVPIGVEDRFVANGSVDDQLAESGLNEKGISEKILQIRTKGKKL